MGTAAALLFAWVQSAPAYREVQRTAVAALGDGDGRTWLDVGCGPGLVARLAAAHGFTVRAIDSDPAMVRLARRPSGDQPGIDATVGDVFGPLPVSDVVSAASLLCQLPDPAGGLAALWAAVRPGGSLLVIETTDRMSPAVVDATSADADARSRRVLHRWAAARSGRAVPSSVWDALPPTSTTFLPLLDGCVVAVLARRSAPAALSRW